jgi:hypothetical protein
MEADVAVPTMLTGVSHISPAVSDSELEWRPGLLIHRPVAAWRRVLDESSASREYIMIPPSPLSLMYCRL